MKLRAFVIVAGVLGFQTSAYAYRPFDGTDADVSGTGEIELEMGPLGYLYAEHEHALVFANTIFNYGFIPRWELVIQGVGVWGTTTPVPPRFLDGGIFVKHVLRQGTLQDRFGPSLALETGVLLPTTDPLASDAGVYMGFIASNAWKELIVHLNASIARSTDRQPDLFLGSIFEFHPKARIRPVSEVYVERHGDRTIPSLLVGAILDEMRYHLSFDAATRVAWENDAPLFELRVGLTWTIPVHKRNPHVGPHVHDE